MFVIAAFLFSHCFRARRSESGKIERAFPTEAYVRRKWYIFFEQIVTRGSTLNFPRNTISNVMNDRFREINELLFSDMNQIDCVRIKADN